MHLTSIGLLARHLTDDNHRELLGRAVHKTKREVEEIVAAIRPRPMLATIVRKLPDRASCGAPDASEPNADPALEFGDERVPPENSGETSFGTCAAGSMSADVPIGRGLSAKHAPDKCRPAKVSPLAPERYSVHFTADAETFRNLTQARELLKHEIPDGDAAAVIGLAPRSWSRSSFIGSWARERE